MAKKNVKVNVQGAQNPAAADPSASLLGSSTLEAVIDIGNEREVQLGQLVQVAFAESGLSVEAWNAMKDEERDALLHVALEEIRALAAQLAAPVDDGQDDTITIDLAPRKEAAKQAGMVVLQGGSCSCGGANYEADADGLVEVPVEYAAILVESHGFKRV